MSDLRFNTGGQSRIGGQATKSTAIPIEEWIRLYAPTMAKGYILGHDIKDPPSYVETVDEVMKAFGRKHICLVEAKWEEGKSPGCFLQFMRGDNKVYMVGREGINLMAGLKDLYMLAIEKSGPERETIMTRIRTMIAFIREIFGGYPEFFSTLKHAVETCNDITKIDVMELLLAKGVLGLPMTSARLASWLFQSLKKSHRHNLSLWTNTRGLVVWLAATKLVVGGETDVDALKMAFDTLRSLGLRRTTSNQDVVECLLREIVPKLVPYSIEFHTALEFNLKYSQEAFRPLKDVVFEDGSVLKGYVSLPYKITAPNGHTDLRWDAHCRTLTVAPKSFNEFSGVSFRNLLI